MSMGQRAENKTMKADRIRAKSLFETAAKGGKLDVLKWGEDLFFYDLKNMLNEKTVAGAALNGHLAVVKYLRTLCISWDSDTCTNAAENGMATLNC
jgi:hypothetical protein